MNTFRLAGVVRCVLAVFLLCASKRAFQANILPSRDAHYAASNRSQRSLKGLPMPVYV